MKGRLIGLGVAVATAFAASSASAAPDTPAVTWNTRSAVFVGTGCSHADTAVLSSGDDLAIIFSNLGVQLPGGTSSQLSDRRNCSIRVPSEIARGVYIGKLTQRVTYGVTKTASSNGGLSTRSTFFGFDVSPLSVSFPAGSALDVTQQVTSREDTFFVHAPWWQGWCSPFRPLSGIYSANIAVSGQRDNPNEDLILFVDGLDLKYEIVSAIYTC